MSGGRSIVMLQQTRKRYPQYETENPDQPIPVGTLFRRSATGAARLQTEGKTPKIYSAEKSCVYGSSYPHSAAGLESGE